MRRRRIIMFFATIMSVAIIAVGFAAWIITSPTDDSINNGSISVETVTLEGWQFETYWVANAESKDSLGADYKPSIVFGKPANVTKGNVANNSEKIENLEAYLYVIAKPIEGTVINDTASVKLDFIKNEVVYAESNYNTLVGASLSQDTISSDKLISGVVITISFQWKTPELQKVEDSITATGNVLNQNPLTYYNGLSFYNKYVAQEAYNYLNNVNTALSGVSFRVTLKGIPATK